MKVRPLTVKQEAFAVAVARLGNQAQAYREIYSETCADSTAYQASSRLMADSRIAARVKNLLDAQALNSRMTVAKVLEHYAELATANPNDLASVRWVCCRHCYGRGHKYQWIDDEEWALAAANAMVAGAAPGAVSDEGGYGFNRTLEPHPDCPRCHGEGTSEVHVADTRKLQGPARRLYAGAKYGKHGIEISMRSQDKALEMLARILKMTTPKDDGEGDDGVLVIKGGLPTAADLKP